ncbi:MAG: hypothetical protein J0G29_02080 [Alphaproteobacteria bacterium]|nr:hypothetical protein [Alphaproteobacteria bacterium]OJV45223.1 MAG: hypothetical protein BGO28_00260 [Alphaproteobacteria bacterium 43-37]
MLALCGALLGFLSSAMPEIMRFINQHRDRLQELAIMDRQMEFSKLGHAHRLEEIRLTSESNEQIALIQSQRRVKVKWVDGLAGSVRPVITYAFFGLYAAVKLASWYSWVAGSNVPTVTALIHIWSGEDEALFAAVMSFWFGHRALNRKR